MKSKGPGELIQIDHMSVNFTEGFTVTIAAINRGLEVYQDYYNHYRPIRCRIGDPDELLSKPHAGILICLAGTEPGQSLYNQTVSKWFLFNARCFTKK